MRKLLIFLMFSQLLSCATRTSPAPIENMTQVPTNLVPLDASVDAKENVADVGKNPTNGDVSSDNSPKLGSLTQNKQAEAVVNATPVKPQITSANKTDGWVMPTQGNIVGQFTQAGKGIDISGTFGQAVYATKSGKVVYSGNGLKGYGNLIIIKHDGTYLSAYAHNKINLVKEGVQVKAGQKIAEMGNGDNGQPILHFEIRQTGKPIDPSALIGQ